MKKNINSECHGSNANWKSILFSVEQNVMAESIVTDWLSDYASLQQFEIRSFASQHEHNHEIAHALFTILNERLKYPDVSKSFFLSLKMTLN